MSEDEPRVRWRQKGDGKGRNEGQGGRQPWASVWSSVVPGR